ncbi:MAG: hypothetical protein AAF639_42495, partial [Chloroflexota bacterium]
MPNLYFTQEAIFFLYNFVFLFLLFIYYLRLKNKSYLSWLLILICGAGSFVLFNTLLVVTSRFSLSRFMVNLWTQLVALYTMLALIQFLYIFPSPRPYLQETKHVAQISVGLAVVATIMVLIASIWGTFTHLEWALSGLQALMILCIFGSLFVLVRRLQADLWQPSGQKQYWIMKPPTLIAPRPKKSIIALVSLTSAILILLIPIGGAILLHNSMLSDALGQVDFLFVSLTIFVACLTIINYTPDRTTVLVKLIGIGILIVMVIVNSMLFFLSPLIRNAYEPAHIMAEQQQIRFTPVQEATAEIKYSVDDVSTESNSGSILTKRPHTTHMDESGQSSLGKPLSLGNEQHRQIALPFEFPFY